jgi:hypothetical protein
MHTGKAWTWRDSPARCTHGLGAAQPGARGRRSRRTPEPANSCVSSSGAGDPCVRARARSRCPHRSEPQ